jgi:transcriptional regulator with XRE-family HTH domain
MSDESQGRAPKQSISLSTAENRPDPGIQLLRLPDQHLGETARAADLNDLQDHGGTLRRGGSARSAENHLRAWREYRRLTQQQLAEKVDTTGAVISLLESGARGLSDTWLRRLAKALDTRPGFLLDFDPDNVNLSLLEEVLGLSDDGKAEALEILRILRKRG